LSGEGFAVRVASSGTVLGLTVGMTTADFDARLGSLSYLEECASGRRKSSLLRRDYGLLEATFRADQSAWVCQSIAVEFHRLCTNGELATEYAPFIGEKLPTRFGWDAVEKSLAKVAPKIIWVQVGQDKSFRTFSFAESCVLAHVLIDDELLSTDEKSGRLWSFEILSSDNWPSALKFAHKDRFAIKA
jgi:hypothetical protein